MKIHEHTEFTCAQCEKHFDGNPKTNITSANPNMRGAYRWYAGVYRADLCSTECLDAWVNENRGAMDEFRRKRERATGRTSPVIDGARAGVEPGKGASEL